MWQCHHDWYTCHAAISICGVQHHCLYCCGVNVYSNQDQMLVAMYQFDWIVFFLNFNIFNFGQIIYEDDADRDKCVFERVWLCRCLMNKWRKKNQKQIELATNSTILSWMSVCGFPFCLCKKISFFSWMIKRMRLTCKTKMESTTIDWTIADWLILN